MGPTEVFSQTVELPLWAVFTLAAYSPKRLSSMVQQARQRSPVGSESSGSSESRNSTQRD